MSAPDRSLLESARVLVLTARCGTLSTLSHKRPGWPFGSVMPYAPDDLGRPVFLISSMAVHAQNLAADPRASLLVMQPEAGAKLLESPRVTLLGTVAAIPVQERERAREIYLAGHGDASLWADFSDFAFYRMEVAEAYYVGGFGVMGWLPGWLER